MASDRKPPSDAGERALGPGHLQGGRRPFLGAAGDTPLHAGALRPGAGDLGAGRARSGGGALSRAAAAQPERQPGARDLLAAAYLTLGRDNALAALLQAYAEDGSAAWTYTAALVAFRRDGDGAASRERLARALKSNPHVPAYLLGERQPPRSLPPYISPGGEDEAQYYAVDFGPRWAKTAGALAWLAQEQSRLTDSS
jgi:hypothetical protein